MMLKNKIQFTVYAIVIFGIMSTVHATSSTTEQAPISLPTSLPTSLPKSMPILLEAALKQISGTVLINHGKGYSIARFDMKINSGDRILTMDGARAVVVQNDGCVVQLKDNSIFTLKLPSICQGGKESIKKTGPYYARAIGSEAVTDVSPIVPEEILENSPLEEEIPPAEASPVDVVEQSVEVEQGIEQGVEVVAESGGVSSFFSSLSTTQIVVTGVAVGLGLAVVGGGGGGGGAVSAQ